MSADHLMDHLESIIVFQFLVMPHLLFLGEIVQSSQQPDHKTVLLAYASLHYSMYQHYFDDGCVLYIGWFAERLPWFTPTNIELLSHVLAFQWDTELPPSPR